MEGLGDERRETVTECVEIDPDPRRLRRSLDELSAILGGTDPDVARRARLLVTELVARATEAGSHRNGSIRLEVSIFASGVRLEASGDALETPGRASEDSDRPPIFPYWALDDLANRWGLDRRADGPAVWFEVRVERG